MTVTVALLVVAGVGPTATDVGAVSGLGADNGGPDVVLPVLTVGEAAVMVWRLAVASVKVASAPCPTPAMARMPA